MKTILALDQGTTSSRAILFDDTGRIIAVRQRELTQHYPQPGWVEHDPGEIWRSQLDVAREVIATSGVTPRDIAAVGITNQRETAVLWDRATGKPVCPAIVWQDRRTASACDALVHAGYEPLIQQTTGLVVDAYFSASKLRWMLDHVPGARTRASRGELAFGTVDSYLIFRLTDGRSHVTDVTNASRTMLLNQHTLDWDDAMLDLFQVPRQVLPQICDSSGLIAETSPEHLGCAIPITGIAGDQQAALFGQRCFRPGLAKNTYGTGCFMLTNVGEKPAADPGRMLSTLAWRRAGAPAQYAVEGAVFIGGAVVQWLRDALGIIRTSADVEPLAASVPDSGGVTFVPAFTGLGAPHWDPHARGTITGLTRGATKAHIARAALESIALQVADVAQAMKSGTGIDITELRVDGGAAVNNMLMQFQADLLGVPVVRPEMVESTALGAAYLAGLATGVWKSESDLASIAGERRVFEPLMSRDEAASRIARWHAAVARARSTETNP